MRYFLPIFVFTALFFGALPVQAQESAWQSSAYVQARLVSAVKTVGSGEMFEAALEVRLSKGWHAYWRMPGEGGLPPRFVWDESVNVEDITVSWPVPKRFDDFGLQSFGYDDTVMFPLAVEIKETGEGVTLDLALSMMLCRDICVPQDLSLSLEIPEGTGAGIPSPRYASQIDAARAQLAVADNLPGLQIKNMVIGPDALVVNAFSAKGFDHVDLYVESGDLYLVAPPEITRDEKDPRYALLRIAAPEGVENLMQALGDQTITLTLTDGRQAVEKTYDF